MNIPIIINNFNWLSTTKKLVEDLIRLGYTDIHILDNGSTYPPLMDWYGQIENGLYKNVTMHLIMRGNLGPRALWDSGYINNFQHLDWIAYTDSDIELNPNTPENFIEELINISSTTIGYNKVGLALSLEDLDLNNNYQNKIYHWETKFWNCPCLSIIGKNIVFEADIDTTFSIIQPQSPFDYKALRVSGDFTAKHKPWQADFDNMTEEEAYIMERLDSKYSTWKGYYLKHLEQSKKNEEENN